MIFLLMSKGTDFKTETYVCRHPLLVEVGNFPSFNFSNKPIKQLKGTGEKWVILSVGVIGI